MKYFAQGAMKNHGPSMYVLGLGYRNGYGLTVDINKDRDLLSKAADKGVQAAIQELQSPVGENQLVKRNSGDTSDIPVSYTHLDVYKRQPRYLLIFNGLVLDVIVE